MNKNIQNIKLQVDFIKEGNIYIAYSHALDLSTCGDTFEKSQERFDEIVRIFFSELLKMGTMGEVLTNLGWKKSRTAWMPPVVVAHQMQTFNIPALA